MDPSVSDFLMPIADGLVVRPSGAYVAEKLHYLRRYIDIFETSMRGKWPQRNYIDLFAGPGKNRIITTDEVLLGSPLLALTTRYPFSGYFFVDYNQSNVDALQERCSAFTDRDRIRIYTGDANKVVSTVVSMIRQYSPRSLNLAFLDPEGLELEWSTVAQLGTLRCDLIIHYSQQGLTRYMGVAYSTSDETRVDRFFGSSEWRKIYEPWHNRPRKTGLHRELLDFYKYRLRSIGYQDVKQADEILTEPLIRNRRRRAPLYRLVFASKHPLGEEFWQKVIDRNQDGQERMF